MTEIIFVLLLVVSLIVNVFFAFYLRWLLKNFTFLSENTHNLLETAENFANHLSAVYELETFYGDETLQNLLTHTKQAIGEIKIYRDVYTLTGDEKQIGDLFNDTGAEEEEEKEEE